MLKKILLPTGCALLVLLAGCQTPGVSPTPTTPATPATPPPPSLVVGTAKISGSEETSLLLDNFTAFVASVNGAPATAGRAGWNTPLEIKAGRNLVAVEFNRGNFAAKADLELVAVRDASYEVKFATDTQLFGQNSFCEFWIVDRATNQAVTPKVKAAVKKR